MRRAIDRHPRHLKDVLSNPLIRKEFLKNAPANDKAVVKAFVDSNRGNMLKTKPKVSCSPLAYPCYPRCFAFVREDVLFKVSGRYVASEDLRSLGLSLVTVCCPPVLLSSSPSSDRRPAQSRLCVCG